MFNIVAFVANNAIEMGRLGFLRQLARLSLCRKKSQFLFTEKRFVTRNAKSPT